MNPDEFLEHLRTLPEYLDQLAHVERIPPRAARYAPLAAPLAPAVQAALEARGITRFYQHQAQAIDAARAGEHVMVATGTASGKTLCYNVPILDTLCSDPALRALYLFPTKALAQDQLRALRGLLSTPALRHLRVGTYDGDTPQQLRAQRRRETALLLSNPDMLSVGILPHHRTWQSFFRRLRYVVLDEAHVYRGVFGSHVACVLRRLRRVCALYGAEPQFILCSATIANPGEHAARLIGQPVTVIDDDGAPAGPRLFALWNPPLVDRAHGVRASVNGQASLILSEMVQQQIRNITFVRARRVAELILIYATEALRREAPELADRVRAYRGGYMPQERREIERRLFDGELLGVTATNALELGIDVGQLDATVLVGYPGTIASTWQQAGRAGRGRRAALSLLLAYDNPLDQYLMRHPEALFKRSPEHALIDPGNSYILRPHLLCAAHEAPLKREEAELFGANLEPVARELEEEGALSPRQDGWYYPRDDYPARRVNLRATSGTPFLLIHEVPDQVPGSSETARHLGAQKVLETLDAATALLRLYPGSVYLHQGESYLVTGLDLGAKVATARPAEVDYYTQAMEVNEVHIVRSLAVEHLPMTDLFFGQVRVREQVTGFMRKQHFTDQILSREPLELPPQAFETQALWFAIPPELQGEIEALGLDLAGGLHAIEHACIGLLPLFAMCDRSDIGGLSTTAHPDTDQPQVFIYDAHPGGVGIARQGFERVREHWRRTLEAVRECPCEAGCPSCIQSPQCGSNNEPLDKRAAVVLLNRLLGPA